MRLIQQANSAHVLDLDDIQILFSYATPVAVWIIGSHFLVSEVDYSRTTTKHIKQFVTDRTYSKKAVRFLDADNVEIVPQSVIEDAIKETT